MEIYNKDEKQKYSSYKIKNLPICLEIEGLFY